ncbi:MAG: MFS transporter [Parvibaculum sp.]|uniref:MFS transporter n=1 Tax=Parvibaculum sp. TaxID=2024848 RepID=UPI002840D20A|nr:MFS transporter [Parvibaculum sp.]MDR3499170.1 MFS transporter [Parvibaculum sp.]
MAYFRNSTINLLNLHYWIRSVAMTGGGAFFAIYLLKAGVSIPGVLVSVALILLGRFFIRPLIVRFAVRWGLRAMIVGGTLFGALQYPLLAEVHGVGLFLAAVIVVSSIGDTVYWTTYHAYFAALGDDEHRGQQIGVREAVVAVVGIASPLLVGWILVTFGPRAAFGVTAAVAMLSALPLLWTRDVKVAPEVPGAFRAALPGVLLFAADGWIAAGYVFVWQIALFTSLGENIMAYGGALALAALFGAVGSLTLGRHIDAGHGKQAVFLAFGTFALIVVLRAVATGNATVAVLANALGSLGACLYVPTLMTAIYTQAKRSPCSLRFHVATEAGWDIGGATGLLVAALLAACGAPLWVGILLSLAGVLANTVMLRRYYPGIPAVRGLT